MMLAVKIFFGLFFSATGLLAQVKPVTFEQLTDLQSKNRKLVMVVIETDWCKYCQALKQTIMHHKEVSDILQKSFYTAFLNVEEKSEINFANTRFKAGPDGVHQLARQLTKLNKRDTYPYLCFLNDKNEIIYQHAGYLAPSSLIQVLKTLLQN